MIDVVQLVTALGVLIGIALVIWELQQTRDLARAQLTSDTFDFMMQRHSAVMGEDLADALATACASPEELTLKQKITLEQYYFSLVDQIRRNLVIEANSGITYQTKEQWAASTRWQFGYILNNSYGRWWWDQLKEAPEDIKVIADQARNDRVSCKEHFEGFDIWITGQS